MNEIKKIGAEIVSWFKKLTKQQQLITIGVAVVVAIFAGRALFGNQLDGKYFAEKDGVSVTIVIHGETGDMIMKQDDEVVQQKIEKINTKNHTFTVKDEDRDYSMKLKFKKEGDSLTVSDMDGDDELVFVKD